MKTTPLHRWHVDHGANMAEFASYSMPLWYPAGARKEHVGVVESAGLFDTSHMAVVLVEGEGAHQLLQTAFSKDLDSCLGPAKTPLKEGRCVYGMFLDNRGHVIDDAIVYKRAEGRYMVVVNAGMGGVIARHLSGLDHAASSVVDLTDRLAKIDIQGPASARILGELLRDPAEAFAGMVYFSFKGGWSAAPGEPPAILLKDGTPILLSRTGYTGEFGFEIFLETEYVEKVWTDLLQAGGDRICACGLAARDSLRAGAGLPLSHQDIGDWPFDANPWEFALSRGDDGGFTKSFIGSEALMRYTPDTFTYPFAGYDPRKIVPGGGSGVVDDQGRGLGDILTCATDMAIGRVGEKIISLATSPADGRPEAFQPKGLCCGFVRVTERLSPGDIIYLTDGKRRIKVEIREDIRPDRTARNPMKKMI